MKIIIFLLNLVCTKLPASIYTAEQKLNVGIFFLFSFPIKFVKVNKYECRRTGRDLWTRPRFPLLQLELLIEDAVFNTTRAGKREMRYSLNY